jgi:phospholipid/cholesterol/gamma-HCH transport system substrate-binding protein
VVFPHVIAAGFTGTPGDGYGHINLQFNNNVPPCTKGYKPPSQWRDPLDESDGPIYPAQCKSGAPQEARGFRTAPSFGSASSVGRSYRVTPYDASTGQVGGVRSSKALGSRGGRQTVFGDDSWQWMLTGSTAGE